MDFQTFLEIFLYRDNFFFNFLFLKWKALSTLTINVLIADFIFHNWFEDSFIITVKQKVGCFKTDVVFSIINKYSNIDAIKKLLNWNFFMASFWYMNKQCGSYKWAPKQWEYRAIWLFFYFPLTPSHYENMLF